MKKAFLFFLALTVTLLLFAACGKSEPTPAPSSQPASADNAAEPANEPTEAPDAETPEETPVETPEAETPAEEPVEEPAPAEEPPQDEPEAPAEEVSTGFEGTEIPSDGVIHTAAELGKVLTDGDLAGSYTVDAAELDMSGIRYGSLGREDAPFTGTFDFGGCTLKNLYQPLFLYTAGAEIANLKIADTKIVCDDELPEDMIRWGLVVSDATDTKITDVDVADTVDLNVCIYSSDACFGGIVGHAADDCEFVRLTSAATITTDSMKIFVPPIIAWFAGRSTNTSFVEDCVFTGTLNDTASGNDSKVAGIIGAVGNATVTGCANYGAITSSDGGQNAGVVGWACGDGYNLENCLNAGTVEGGSYTGGIMGYSNRAGGQLTLCLNVGSVEGASPDNSGAIGGLIKNTETWSYSYWVEDTSPVGYNSVGNASITDLAGCASIEAALSEINAVGGKFAMDGGRVVVTP